MRNALPTEPAGVPVALANTTDLVTRARDGDLGARDLLFERALPALCRWARGRLPRWARDLGDTQDIVQDTVLHTLGRLDFFEIRRPGGLHAYLRRAVTNRIRDQIRRVKCRPSRTELSDDLSTATPSPLRYAAARETVEKYQAALQRLRPADREAIIARLEWQLPYEEVATLLNKPTAGAARVAVARALASLIEAMDNDC